MKKTRLASIVIFMTVLPLFQLYSQSSTVYLAPGATTPTDLKSTLSTARVTATSPGVCDAGDIVVFPSALPQSEIHISINKQNPQILLLSSNTFPVTNTWQGAYWSTNGGANWTGSDALPNNLSGRGDPSTAFDAAGNGYVATMSRPVTSTNINDDPNGYSLLKTMNSGATWTTLERVANNITGFDKEMIAADDTPGSPFANNIYSAWSVNPGLSSATVGFHRSTDGGNTFSTPITLKTGWGQGTNVQTGPNGEVYVCWADYSGTSLPARGLGFARSTDGGATFTAATQPFTYTGIRTSSGPDANFNGIRVNDFPSMAVDKSNGPKRGRIYVVYAAKEMERQ